MNVRTDGRAADRFHTIDRQITVSEQKQYRRERRSVERHNNGERFKSPQWTRPDRVGIKTGPMIVVMVKSDGMSLKAINRFLHATKTAWQKLEVYPDWWSGSDNSLICLQCGNDNPDILEQLAYHNAVVDWNYPVAFTVSTTTSGSGELSQRAKKFRSDRIHFRTQHVETAREIVRQSERNDSARFDIVLKARAEREKTARLEAELAQILRK